MKETIVKITTILSLLFILFGCGVSYQNIITEQGRCEFQINRNYEQVYSVLVRSNIFPPFGDGEVLNVIYPESKRAEISLRYDLNNNYFNHTEITSISESDTKVVYYYTDAFEYGCSEIRRLFNLPSVQQ